MLASQQDVPCWQSNCHQHQAPVFSGKSSSLVLPVTGIVPGLEPGPGCVSTALSQISFLRQKVSAFCPKAIAFFQGDFKGTLPNSDTCRQANIPVNTFIAPALVSTPLERDARSSLARNNHSGLSLVALFIRRAQSFPHPASHQPGQPGGVTHPVAVTGSLQQLFSTWEPLGSLSSRWQPVGHRGSATAEHQAGRRRSLHPFPATERSRTRAGRAPAAAQERPSTTQCCTPG